MFIVRCLRQPQLLRHSKLTFTYSCWHRHRLRRPAIVDTKRHTNHTRALEGGLRESNVARRLLPDRLLELQLRLLVPDQLSYDKPRTHEAERVGEQHDDCEGAVERRALLRKQEEVDVDGQLRQQREEPVTHELGHLLLHVADKARMQTQWLAHAPHHKEDGVEDAIAEKVGARYGVTRVVREGGAAWRHGRIFVHSDPIRCTVLLEAPKACFLGVVLLLVVSLFLDTMIRFLNKSSNHHHATARTASQLCSSRRLLLRPNLALPTCARKEYLLSFDRKQAAMFAAARLRMRFQHLSTFRSLFCARFRVVRVPSSSFDSEFQSPSGNVAVDRRLEIFFEQQVQPWNAVKHLDTSIIVTVIPPGAGTPTSFTFDAKSPPPTPAHILSLIPDSMKHFFDSSKSGAGKVFAPIAAAANGRVVGLSMFAH